MNQYDDIVAICKENGSISPMEAYPAGITKLATRISEMTRYKGYEFDRQMQTTTNRHGKSVQYMRYWLRVEPK